MAAATKASAMPVLPLVGSTRVDLPGVIVPCFSSASIMPTPMRSLTEASGIEEFQLEQNVGLDARLPAAMRWIRTSGVSPMVSVMEL